MNERVNRQIVDELPEVAGLTLENEAFGSCLVSTE